MVADELHSHPERVIELRDSGPGLAFVDPLRIEQVLINLIDNAIKFSPPDSRIDIDAGGSEQCWVRIAVRDRGAGIPVEKRERIFERFYQAHPELHRGGMGLGLFLCREIAEMHGGSIAVEQPEDGGSRFVVRLPTCLDNEAPTISARRRVDTPCLVLGAGAAPLSPTSREAPDRSRHETCPIVS